MINSERGGWGYAAMQAGTPDFGENGVDVIGAKTDAIDTIANVLHYLFQNGPNMSLDENEKWALDALDQAKRHFRAEIRGG